MPPTFGFNTTAITGQVTINDTGGTANGHGGGLTFTENAIQFTLSISNPNSSGGPADAILRMTDSTPTTVGGRLTLQEIGVFNPGSPTFDASFHLALPTTGARTAWSGPVQISLGSMTGTWLLQLDGANTVTANATGVYTLTSASPATTITFVNSVGLGNVIDSLVIEQIIGTVNCYMPGTQIATPNGSVAIETLRPGDRILTAQGTQTTVKWLAEQHVSTRFELPARVDPIRIAAGALDENIPSRDLFVSPDHAIAIDGYLINAAALVNGTTITQVAQMSRDGFTYYHVETDHHELILAESCPAESYLDMPNREGFVNGAERADAPPIAEMDLPRPSTARLMPERVQARLRAREEALVNRRVRAA